MNVAPDQTIILGKPLYVLFPYGQLSIALKGEGGKACQDGLGHFFVPCLLGVQGLAMMVWGTFFHICLFDIGGLKLFGH